jgi:hypothetical protein
MGACLCRIMGGNAWYIFFAECVDISSGRGAVAGYVGVTNEQGCTGYNFCTSFELY